MAGEKGKRGGELMGMIVVGRGFVPGMNVFVGAVFAGVGMAVDVFVARVLVGMGMIVGVFVAVHVGVDVGVLADPGMFVFVLVFVGMFVAVFMMVRMIALHGNLLCSEKNSSYFGVV